MCLFLVSARSERAGESSNRDRVNSPYTKNDHGHREVRTIKNNALERVMCEQGNASRINTTSQRIAKQS